MRGMGKRWLKLGLLKVDQSQHHEKSRTGRDEPSSFTVP